MSVILGLFGCFFIWLMKQCLYLKKVYRDYWFFNPWVYSLTVALIMVNAQFFSRLMQDPDKSLMKTLIDIDLILEESDRPVCKDLNPPDWGHYD